jgi:hypothetical protein
MYPGPHSGLWKLLGGMDMMVLFSARPYGAREFAGSDQHDGVGAELLAD